MKIIYYDLLDGCLKQTYALVKSILLFFLDAVNLQNYLLLGNMNGWSLWRICNFDSTSEKILIPKGRQLVKTMIRICLVCKKYSAKPADQLSGQLPRDRITQSPPFQIVGIDFTGAILVKDNQGTRKSYVSLFTCAVTRAVHLELVSDMSTKCFLLALRRFLARRGNCKVIYFDNARTFKAAERELTYFANILKDSEFQSFVADKGIHWKFIVERAPWWGGFYERLVKTIKDPLRKILGRALLTFEELSTILSEVEVIVNHRPLTYVENDPGEPEPLTPAHFLELGYGDSKYPIHFIELIDATTAKESYKKRKTYRTLLLKQLWRRWKEQYLLQLKPANHFKTPSVHKNLKLSDVVLVEGNVKSKLLWELGIIKEIFIGRDDNINYLLDLPCKIYTNRFKFQDKNLPIPAISVLFDETVEREFQKFFIIATDASKNDQITSIAGISKKSAFAYRINHYNSIFSAETLAICQALDDLVESNVNLLVLSDSLSVLSALQNFSIKSNKVIHRLANKIYMLSNYVNQLILLWTPGHSKIVWNEQADNLARSVTESNVYIDWIASEDIHKNIYRNRIQKINETFYSSKYFEKLGNIPTIDISKWTENRREEILSTRIFNKMIITPVLLHRFNLQDNAMCITCKRINDLDHIILNCIRYTRHRNNLWSILRIDPHSTITFRDFWKGQ
ncbi:integrase catalytic domain-containing protein [Trichonephila clavipes]|nr:integrase catalytic domain-containing protein [Trichonephila clavipes]